MLRYLHEKTDFHIDDYFGRRTRGYGEGLALCSPASDGKELALLRAFFFLLSIHR